MTVVNPVLEEYSGMSDFLERVAKIKNPIMRYKVITNGFEDLEELAKMDPEHAQRSCNVIRKSTDLSSPRIFPLNRRWFEKGSFSSASTTMWWTGSLTLKALMKKTSEKLESGLMPRPKNLNLMRSPSLATPIARGCF